MTRILLQYILPLVLPFFLYWLWTYVLRRRNVDNDKNKPEIKNIGIYWATLTGILLMLASILSVVFLGGAPPGQGTYQSPRYENGKIIPPRLE